MSKHEIRLRRQKMTSHGAERFRNYGAVLQRHEQEKRLKKIVRVFGYFLVILILVMLLVIVTRMEKKVAPPDGKKNQTTWQPSAGRFNASTLQLFNRSRVGIVVGE